MTFTAEPGTTYGHSRRRRGLLLVLVVAVVLLVAGFTAAVVRVTPAVPAGTFVAGVAVGGLHGEELTAALDGPVRRAVDRPLRVTAGPERIEVKPAELGISLDVAATRDSLGQTRLRRPGTPARRDVPPALTIDAAAAAATLTDRLRTVARPPRDRSVRLGAPQVKLDLKGDASFTASDSGVEVDPGEPGRAVDAGAAVGLIAEAVRAARPEVRLAVTTVAPGDRTPKLAGVDQLIGSFTTYHPCCAPRVTNIERIAALVDGTVIAPGTTFSLNDTAGERTAARGFVAAPAIVDGELEDQLGGGVSQFSTTLFNAAWFAGLPVLKHQPHSLYISRYPPGREATLDWRAIDQQIRNDTRAPVVIRVTTTATAVTVGLYGHTGDRVVSSVTGPRQPRGTGFGIEVRRTVRQDGAVTGRDTLRWTYAGLD